MVFYSCMFFVTKEHGRMCISIDVPIYVYTYIYIYIYIYIYTWMLFYISLSLSLFLSLSLSLPRSSQPPLLMGIRVSIHNSSTSTLHGSVIKWIDLQQLQRVICSGFYITAKTWHFPLPLHILLIRHNAFFPAALRSVSQHLFMCLMFAREKISFSLSLSLDGRRTTNDDGGRTKKRLGRTTDERRTNDGRRRRTLDGFNDGLTDDDDDGRRRTTPTMDDADTFITPMFI